MQALDFVHVDPLAVLWLHFTEIALILKRSLNPEDHRQNAFTNTSLIRGGGCFTSHYQILNQQSCKACRYSVKVLNKNNLILNYKSALNPKDIKTDCLTHCTEWWKFKNKSFPYLHQSE